MPLRIFAFIVFIVFLLSSVAISAKARQKAPQSATQPAAASKVPVSTSNNPANLAQLMRGTLFLEANVIYAAQGKNPADVPPAKDPYGVTNPLEGAYGKWEAVENSSLAIIETADLLTVPGRSCSNGRPVPTNNPDWEKLVQGLREAGIKSYKAAQAKSQDKVSDATDVLTTACSNCHVKYRDKEKLKDRCR
jgi:hypothetical protein